MLFPCIISHVNSVTVNTQLPQKPYSLGEAFASHVCDLQLDLTAGAIITDLTQYAANLDKAVSEATAMNAQITDPNIQGKVPTSFSGFINILLQAQSRESAVNIPAASAATLENATIPFTPRAPVLGIEKTYDNAVRLQAVGKSDGYSVADLGLGAIFQKYEGMQFHSQRWGDNITAKELWGSFINQERSNKEQPAIYNIPIFNQVNSLAMSDAYLKPATLLELPNYVGWLRDTSCFLVRDLSDRDGANSKFVFDIFLISNGVAYKVDYPSSDDKETRANSFYHAIASLCTTYQDIGSNQRYRVFTIPGMNNAVSVNEDSGLHQLYEILHNVLNKDN